MNLVSGALPCPAAVVLLGHALSVTLGAEEWGVPQQ